MSVVFVCHVEWEGPHRIVLPLARHFAGQTVRPLQGEPLPGPEAVAGAVFMGGPMNIDETSAFPGLLAEVRWIERALEAELPLLGICLGSQLLARALGAPVTRAAQPELGWDALEVHAPDDPVVGPLAPRTTVLHWHGDEFATPPGAERLSSSRRSECQAFRAGNAWGLLFHPEADAGLVRAWLDAPAMAAEAEAALGAGARERLLADAARHEALLTARSTRGFEAFARLVCKRATEMGVAPHTAARTGR